MLCQQTRRNFYFWDHRWSSKVLLSGPTWGLQVESDQVGWGNQRCASFGKIKSGCWRNVRSQHSEWMSCYIQAEHNKRASKCDKMETKDSTFWLID